MAVRIIIEQRVFPNKWKIWREGETVGPMAAQIGARERLSKQEALEKARRLMPEIDQAAEKEIDKAEVKIGV